jgi:hypothetical protein
MRKFLHNRRSFLKKGKTKATGLKALTEDIRLIIEADDLEKVQNLESHRTMLYWQIGKRLREEYKTIKDQKKRQKILKTLSKTLTADYGKYFNERNLSRAVKFSACFSDARTASLLAHSLTWNHFIALTPIRDALKRNFYAEMSKIMKWNPKELQSQIAEELFERTSSHCDISNKQASVILDALKGGMTEGLSDFIYDSTDPLEF